jgi:hypothetical protein
MILNKRSLLFIGIALLLMLVLQVRPSRSFAATISLNKDFPTVHQTQITSTTIQSSSTSTGTTSNGRSYIYFRTTHPGGLDLGGQTTGLRGQVILVRPECMAQLAAGTMPSTCIKGTASTTVTLFATGKVFGYAKLTTATDGSFSVPLPVGTYRVLPGYIRGWRVFSLHPIVTIEQGKISTLTVAYIER